MPTAKVTKNVSAATGGGNVLCSTLISIKTKAWLYSFRSAKVTPHSEAVKGFASSERKKPHSEAVRFFPLEPLTALRVPLWKWQGKRKKSVWLCSVLALCVFPCGMCIYSKKCPCRTILAFLALLKKILRLPLWHGTKTERKDYIPVYRT